MARGDDALATILAPALERAEAGKGIQVLVVAPDLDAALDAARVSQGHANALVPVTSTRRAGRLVARGAVAMVGTPGDLAALVRAAQLKLDGVRHVVLLWADETIASTAAADDLEILLAELPKEAARAMVIEAQRDDVDAFVERFMRRPRRVSHPVAAASAAAIQIQYLTVAANARPWALRRVLDEVDPTSAVVVVSTDESEAEVRSTFSELGYGEDDALVSVTRGDVPAGTALVLYYDALSSAESLEGAVAAAPAAAVALVAPRELSAFLRIAANATAIALTHAPREAHAAEEALRAELRSTVSGRALHREILTLEPLLADLDPVEIAAAALRLLDTERIRLKKASKRAPEPRVAEIRTSEPVTVLPASVDAEKAIPATIQPIAAPVARVAKKALFERPEAESVPSATKRAPAERSQTDAGADVSQGVISSLKSQPSTLESGPPTSFTRIFVNVGERDGARHSDFVGAISNEAGISSQQIGKVDLRDSHALIEISSDLVSSVVEKMNGVTIRGRRIVARIDSGPSEAGRERIARRETRERKDSDDRPSRGPRSPRGGSGERGARARTDRTSGGSFSERRGPPRERTERTGGYAGSSERSGPPRERASSFDTRSGPPRERTTSFDKRSGPPRDRSDRPGGFAKRSGPPRAGSGGERSGSFVKRSGPGGFGAPTRSGPPRDRVERPGAPPRRGARDEGRGGARGGFGASSQSRDDGRAPRAMGEKREWGGERGEALSKSRRKRPE